MPDKDIFDKQRKAWASRIPNIEKVEILTDVDFSQTAEFYLTGNQKVLLYKFNTLLNLTQYLWHRVTQGS